MFLNHVSFITKLSYQLIISNLCKKPILLYSHATWYTSIFVLFPQFFHIQRFCKMCIHSCKPSSEHIIRKHIRPHCYNRSRTGSFVSGTAAFIFAKQPARHRILKNSMQILFLHLHRDSCYFLNSPHPGSPKPLYRLPLPICRRYPFIFLTHQFFILVVCNMCIYDMYNFRNQKSMEFEPFLPPYVLRSICQGEKFS